MSKQVHITPPQVPATDWDRITGITALVIGVVSLLVSSYTAHLQRAQVRADIWPHLMEYIKPQQRQFSLVNKGTGPAIIKAAQVRVDGMPRVDWDAVKTALGLSAAQAKLWYYTSLTTNVFQPGEEIAFFATDDADAFVVVFHQRQRLVVSTCYCSVLDDCWIQDDLHTLETDLECSGLVGQRFLQ